METDWSGANCAMVELRRSSDLALAFYAIVSVILQLPRLPKAVVSSSVYFDREPNVTETSRRPRLILKLEFGMIGSTQGVTQGVYSVRDLLVLIKKA